MLSENELTAESEQENETDQAPENINKQRPVLTSQEKRALNDALIRFTCCGRCSLFLASYRLSHDDSVMQTAVKNIEGGWLALPWGPGMRSLISKSYGCQIDVESYHFESCCPECRSLFVYSEPDSDETLSLRIKM